MNDTAPEPRRQTLLASLADRDRIFVIMATPDSAAVMRVWRKSGRELLQPCAQ